MSLALPDASRSATSRLSEARVSGLLLAFVAIFLFAVAAFSPSVLGDGDTWSHLATGEWMLAHGRVPRADPFSFSMAGAPWVAHEWLSELLLTFAWRSGGWSGVALLTAAAAAGAALILGLRCARDLSGAALGVTVALGVTLWLPNLLARPHVLALPLAAAWAAALLGARDRDGAPPLALLPLMTLWSNMHGGFIFGLALIGPFALEAAVSASGPRRLAALGRWGLFGLTATAAALINPYGVEALIFPFRLMGVENLSRISEWAPQDFGRVGPFEVALVLLLGFALTRPASTPPVRAALLAGLLAMALAHARHAQLLGLVAPMLLARPIAGAIGAGRPGEPGEAARVGLAATLAAALALAALRLTLPIVRVDGPAAPISALAAVPPEVRAKPVLNGYSFGGYLIWSGVGPFIDGRADMYGGAMLGLERKIVAGDPAALEETLRRYRIAWTMFAPGDGVVAILDREPGWRRLYADAVAVVHVRE
jgi:hypothetical protein